MRSVISARSLAVLLLICILQSWMVRSDLDLFLLVTLYSCHVSFVQTAVYASCIDLLLCCFALLLRT